MSGRIDRPGTKHPAGPHPELNNPRTAHDIKELHDLLSGFRDDELKRIPVLPPGSRLEQGATYLDLADAERAEFTATGDLQVLANEWIVPKSAVDYPLWNRLRGLNNPQRTQGP
jgi:hypothetical protein